MGKSLPLILLAGLLIGCTQDWEYLSVPLNGQANSAFHPREFEPNDSILNVYGENGWELVAIVPFTETNHPNFGDDRFVTGLQPNVRTQAIVFYFKRKK